MPMLHSGASAG